MNLLNLSKSIDKPCAIVGDTVTYSIVATNSGLDNISLDNVVIYDILSPDLKFINGSVAINGKKSSLSGIAQGINLGILNVGQSNIVTFKALILGNSTTSILNTSYSTFEYKVPGHPTQIGNSASNTVTLTPQVANISVNKTADTNFVVLDDIITYTVTLTNTGTVNANNVVFLDTLPISIELLDGSFSVNGVGINSVNLSQGVNIGSIPKKSKTIISYSVKVVSQGCSMNIVNLASVNFNYTLLNGCTGRTSSKSSVTSSVNINLGITNFKQLILEEYLQIPCQKPNIEEINKISGTIDIVKCHVIKTNKVVSAEGQQLTGYKLIIHGLLKEFIEYTACEEVQSVHFSQYDIPFSTFIVLPFNYVFGSKIEVEGIVEDIYSKTIDCKNFFTNASVLINAKIILC